MATATVVDDPVEQMTVSSVPKVLIKNIETLAGLEKRSRSAETIFLLEEIVAKKLKEAKK